MDAMNRTKNLPLM